MIQVIQERDLEERKFEATLHHFQIEDPHAEQVKRDEKEVDRSKVDRIMAEAMKRKRQEFQKKHGK